MKRILIFMTLLTILLSTYSLSFAEDLELFGEGAVLLDYDSLEILYEKNPHKQLFPASTTKIMTGILALENGNLEDMITIDQEVVDYTNGSHIALEPGEELTLAQLLDALLIESANDAAVAIAKHISGSVDSFVVLMNDKAKEIGAVNTNFKNPSGLPDEEHLTTAYDLALIGRYAMENDDFKNIVKNYRGLIPITNKKNEERHLNSSNRMLYSNDKIVVNGESVTIRYEGVNGVKSGYTNAAQYCLVTSYERDNQSFIVVSLKADRNNIYSDTHRLLDYGLENFKNTKIAFSGKFIDNFQVANGSIPQIPAITKSDAFYIMDKSGEDQIQENVVLFQDLVAPIAEDEVIGRVEYVLGGKVIAESELVSAMNVRAIEEPSIFAKVLSKWYWFVIIGFCILRTITILKIKKRRKKRKARTLYKVQ